MDHKAEDRTVVDNHACALGDVIGEDPPIVFLYARGYITKVLSLALRLGLNEEWVYTGFKWVIGVYSV